MNIKHQQKSAYIIGLALQRKFPKHHITMERTPFLKDKLCFGYGIRAKGDHFCTMFPQSAFSSPEKLAKKIYKDIHTWLEIVENGKHKKGYARNRSK